MGPSSSGGDYGSQRELLGFMECGHK